MKRLKVMLLMVVMSVCLTGCGGELWQGVGLGLGAGSTVDAVGKGLDEKRAQLSALYDEAILKMENAGDLDELEVAKAEVDRLQVALTTVVGSKTVLGEVTDGVPLQEKGFESIIEIVLGIAVLLGGNEFRKRRGYDIAKQKLMARATPADAAVIHETIKKSTLLG